MNLFFKESKSKRKIFFAGGGGGGGGSGGVSRGIDFLLQRIQIKKKNFSYVFLGGGGGGGEGGEEWEARISEFSFKGSKFSDFFPNDPNL